MIALLATLAWGADAATEWDPPTDTTWTDQELAQLDAGEVVYRYDRDSGASAVVVEASPDAVWAQVLDYDSYVEFMPYVTDSAAIDSYDADSHRVHDCTMQLTTKGMVTNYRVRNYQYADQGYMWFVMLPAEGTPLKQAVGWWVVEPWEADPSRTLMAYHLDIDTAWYVPGFVKRKASRGLPRVTGLMRDRIEGASGSP